MVALWEWAGGGGRLTGWRALHRVRMANVPSTCSDRYPTPSRTNQPAESIMQKSLAYQVGGGDVTILGIDSNFLVVRWFVHGVGCSCLVIVDGGRSRAQLLNRV